MYVVLEVTPQELEATLGALASKTRDRLAGIHGPQTLAWEHGREVANFIGAGRAVLLQLAHPPVATAIAEHSKTFTDLRGRFERTFSIVFAMTFGDLDAAVRSARRLHRIHQRIRGTLPKGGSYAANSRDSLRWVYATLVDSVFAVRRFCGEPLSPAVCELYYRETKRFALLFGLTDADLPASYRDFRQYVEGAADDALIEVSPAARDMATALLASPMRVLSPLASQFREISAGLLPERVAHDFGLKQNARARGRATALYRGLKSCPEQLRFFPDYLDALARLGLRNSRAARLDRASRAALRRYM